MVGSHTHGGTGGLAVGWVLVAPFVLAAVVYLSAAIKEQRGGRGWLWWRSALWIAGLSVALAGLSLHPSADSDDEFTMHAVGHVLTGMLAPLLLVMAAPATLALRTLSTMPARRLSRLLRSAPARVLADPVFAATLNVGSMWLLYRTSLLELSLTPFFHYVAMIHLFICGYLFTASLVSPDPTPHRRSTATRLIVLTLAIAAHSILTKFLFIDPVPGFERDDVRTGAQLMFYAGDAVDLVLVILVLAQWYRASGRRIAMKAEIVVGEEGRGAS